MIGVDDAHLLDDASAAVIHHLALRATGNAISGLLDQTFGTALDLVGRQRLSRVSAGNPLLLWETLRAGLDTGALRYPHGVWRWDGSVRPTTRLVEVVTARLGAVDRAVARVLELVVVWAAIGASAAAGITGDHERATVARERGLAAAHPETLPWGRVEVECGYCMALLAMGRVEEAWAVSEREYLAAVRVESPEPLGVWAGFHGVVAKARGDLATAAQHGGSWAWAAPAPAIVVTLAMAARPMASPARRGNLFTRWRRHPEP